MPPAFGQNLGKIQLGLNNSIIKTRYNLVLRVISVTLHYLHYLIVHCELK